MKMERVGRAGALVFASIAALVASAGVAQAAEDTTSAVDLLAAAAPEVVAEALTPSLNDEGDLVFDANTTTVNVPADPTEGVTIYGPEGTRRVVGLPVTDHVDSVTDADGIRVYQNDDATKATVAVKADTVTFTTILESADAPAEYAYDYASYGELRQADDGGVTLWEGDTSIGFFYNPWAIDADGREVPTHYEVVESELIQVVDHIGKGFSYPIVADPTYTFPGSNSLYTKIVEDRDASTGAVVLHVYPGPAPFTNLSRSTVISYFNAIVPSTYERNNIHDQLACHAYNAGFKSPWNLETWRPDVGYAATVAAACNP